MAKTRKPFSTVDYYVDDGYISSMSHNSIELQEALVHARKLFFLDMDRSTSAFVYGSAATGSWCAARSDLDLLLFLKRVNFPRFLTQLERWKSLGLPVLDGYLCFEDSSELFAFRIDDLFDGRPDLPGPLVNRVLVPDLWKMQFRSSHLFGSEKSLNSLPSVDVENLRKWAYSNRDEYWIPSIQEGIPVLSARDQDLLVPLTPTIWVASGAARIVNLIRGGLPISKQESLKLFISYLPKSEKQMNFLIDNYELNDEEFKILTVKQALEISHHCLELLQSS